MKLKKIKSRILITKKKMNKLIFMTNKLQNKEELCKWMTMNIWNMKEKRLKIN